MECLLQFALLDRARPEKAAPLSAGCGRAGKRRALGVALGAELVTLEGIDEVEGLDPPRVGSGLDHRADLRRGLSRAQLESWS